ncbi:MAG TPA: cytochrome c oxidase subunit II [Planctomycetota bacterium]|nr:cytochrome c oxidase subunit II [Planctomycetota bacterium]
MDYDAPLPFMPPNLSEHGGSLDSLMLWVHVLMAVLFVGWGAFFLWTLFRFRARANAKADYAGVKSHASSWLEGGVAAIEAILLFFLAVPLWSEWVRTDEAVAAGDALELRVVAQQFQWNVQYPGPDGKLGPLKLENIDDTVGDFVGVDRSHADGADDIVATQLIVPVNRPVRIHLTTKDVIHSFFLPVMRVKQDTIPGQSIPVAFKATMTSRDYKESEFKRHPEKYKRPQDVPDFEIACAQLCGGQHYKMDGPFHIVSAEEWATIRDGDTFFEWEMKHLSWMKEGQEQAQGGN